MTRVDLPSQPETAKPTSSLATSRRAVTGCRTFPFSCQATGLDSVTRPPSDNIDYQFIVGSMAALPL